MYLNSFLLLWMNNVGTLHETGKLKSLADTNNRVYDEFVDSTISLLSPILIPSSIICLVFYIVLPTHANSHWRPNIYAESGVSETNIYQIPWNNSAFRFTSDLISPSTDKNANFAKITYRYHVRQWGAAVSQWQTLRLSTVYENRSQMSMQLACTLRNKTNKQC